MPVLRVCSSHSLVRGAAQKFLILVALLLTERFGSAGTLAAAEPGMQLLPNGMALILIPNSTPTVSVRLLVPAGGRDDPRGLEGLAHYVEHLIASATPGRSAAALQIAARRGVQADPGSPGSI